jgi:sec-independent protein translocase protein TatC
MDEREQPFMSHLSELRVCLTRAIIGVLVSMTICYVFVEHIMLLLRKPMMKIMPDNSVFVVLSPQEYFFTELKAALFCGIILACPWIFWQLWRFVAPGLYFSEKRLFLFFVIGASFCFVLGVCFAYFLVFPPAFEYFLGMLPEGVKGSYSIGMLYGFSITLLIAFGVIFQTPIAVFLLIVFDLVPASTFAKYRRLIFVLAFVVGALLTPPDPITQVMLALPAYGLFELGLLLAKLVKKSTPQIEASKLNEEL